jgi:NADPH:quinone reductase-like Zn-dependent oxidoreductase
MKAFVYHKYGLPKEVLSLQEVAQPQPKDDEVLINVAALSLNPAEGHLLSASIWMVRLTTGLWKPKNPIPGADLAGTVVAVGEKVKSFKVGDRVFGRTNTGGLSELACLSEKSAALIPAPLTFENAAALPLVSATALTALHHKRRLQVGERVLINGASGGIGTIAVQLAKHYDTHVTAVCSGKNADLVRSLGADEVIDYTATDFTKEKPVFDVIIDLIGNRSIGELNQILKPGGRCVLVGFTNAGNMLSYMLRSTWLSKTTRKSFTVIDAPTTRKDLEFIGQLVAEGKVEPVIDQVYAFEDIPTAFERLGTRRATGKLVVRLK